MGREKHTRWSGPLRVALAIALAASGQNDERTRDRPARNATSRFERDRPAMVRGGPARRRGERHHSYHGVGRTTHEVV